MNPEKYRNRNKNCYNSAFVSYPHTGPKKTRKKTIAKAFTGNTRPKEVYVLRSDEEHDDAGVWHKVFMCYGGNTVMMAEFENSMIVNTESFNYKEAKDYWNKMIREDINMHRDDSCIKGLPLGDVKL